MIATRDAVLSEVGQIYELHCLHPTQLVDPLEITAMLACGGNAKDPDRAVTLISRA